MVPNFKYWEDCLDPEDMEAMWKDPEVSKEWIDAGVNKGQKVELSRAPNGQAFLTHIEMKAVAGIVARKHFESQIDQDMICAIVELGSWRKPLETRYVEKAKDFTVGIMQILPRTAQFLFSKQGYTAYDINQDPELLYRPVVNVYFGAAYLKWLSTVDPKGGDEEFVVKAYRHGTRRPTQKCVFNHWQRYLFVKQDLPFRRKNGAWMFDNRPPLRNHSTPPLTSQTRVCGFKRPRTPN